MVLSSYHFSRRQRKISQEGKPSAMEGLKILEPSSKANANWLGANYDM